MKYSKKNKILLFFLIPIIIGIKCTTYAQQKKNYKKNYIEIEDFLLSHKTKNALVKIDSILITDFNSLSIKNTNILKTLKVEALTRGLLFEESLILANELLQSKNLNTYLKIRILINNALAYEYVGDFKNSEKKLQQLKTIYQQDTVKKNELYGRYLYRTSSFYRMQGIKKEGLDYAKKAYKFGLENDYKEVTAVGAMCIGYIKQKEESIGYLKKTLHFYKSINNIYGMTGIYNVMTKIKIKQKEYKKAIMYCDTVIRMLKDKDHYEQNAQSYLLKSRVYEQLNQLDSAIINLKKHAIIFDKHKINQQSIKVNQLTYSYDIEKIKILNNNKIEIEQTTNFHQKIALLIMTIGLILIGFFLIKTINNKKLINKQKLETEKNLEEKDILLKEVHHRVKNNLQVINSILDIQNSKIDDTRFNKILEEGQNRIQSMALIHQQLYQSDNLTDILMEKYIKDLVDNIARFNTNNKIGFTILANQIKFKISTSVPLGLIINELITNIYKHAFKKGEKGEVIIGINKIKENHFKLIVKDNGKGFPKNFDFDNTDSLGVKLINILTKQLKGNIIYSNDHGAKCEISFRDDVAV